MQKKYRTLNEVTEEYFHAHLDKIDSYLTEIFQNYAEDNNVEVLPASLRILTRVRGATDMAESIGVTRQGLQKALSSDGNPRLENVTFIMKAMVYCLVPQKLTTSTHAPHKT